MKFQQLIGAPIQGNDEVSEQLRYEEAERRQQWHQQQEQQREQQRLQRQQQRQQQQLQQQHHEDLRLQQFHAVDQQAPFPWWEGRQQWGTGSVARLEGPNS